MRSRCLVVENSICGALCLGVESVQEPTVLRVQTRVDPIFFSNDPEAEEEELGF
jgi:hypothetical protein